MGGRRAKEIHRERKRDVGGKKAKETEKESEMWERRAKAIEREGEMGARRARETEREREKGSRSALGLHAGPSIRIPRLIQHAGIINMSFSRFGAFVRNNKSCKTIHPAWWVPPILYPFGDWKRQQTTKEYTKFFLLVRGSSWFRHFKHHNAVMIFPNWCAQGSDTLRQRNEDILWKRDDIRPAPMLSCQPRSRPWEAKQPRTEQVLCLLIRHICIHIRVSRWEQATELLVATLNNIYIYMHIYTCFFLLSTHPTTQTYTHT